LCKGYGSDAPECGEQTGRETFHCFQDNATFITSLTNGNR